jgi:DNA-binding response OmpR family regulator
VIIADDDPLIRGFEADFLATQGYEVVQAGNGEEALRLATAAQTVSLLITDFVMPGIDGVELIRRFRATHSETPVLMVSGSLSDVGAIVECFDRCDTLAKPFLLDSLLEKVRSLVDAAVPARDASGRTDISASRNCCAQAGAI